MNEQAQIKLPIEPLHVNIGLRAQACEAIRAAIMRMDIYGQPEEIRLDERQLCQDLGVSRTPIREALSVLEQEGFVRSVPRRGIFVVRKSKREIVEMITVWAAIESMAARLAATRATAEEIAGLRQACPRSMTTRAGRSANTPMPTWHFTRRSSGWAASN